MNKLDKIYRKSKKIKIDGKSKIVIMSDCHRGSGDNYDSFIKNRNIFESASLYYYKNNYTYIELGDGDDMWEVNDYKDIINEHIQTFKILKKFNDNNRLFMIYGNHDISKKNKNILKKYFYKYYNSQTKKYEKLLKNINVYESLVLTYNKHAIFMVHGHQIDILNGTFWRLSRFLVRHLWKHLEHFILKDPTSAAKNHKITRKIEKKLNKWSIKNNKILISGHTHRPIYPKVGKSLYFNDGSCIHPNGITCLEIENGQISLVKWAYKLENGNLITVGRSVIEGNESIDSFFLNK